MGLSEKFRPCEPQWMKRRVSSFSEPPAPPRASTGSPTNQRMLTHFSEEPLSLVSRTYEQIPGTKPQGLWLSDEGERAAPRRWSDWVKLNSTCGMSVKHSREFSVDLAQVKVIEDMPAMFEFNQVYGRGSDNELCRDFNWINWPEVAKYYAGILITPYQRQAWEHELYWYTTWDCASGCVWDLSVLRPVHKGKP